MMLKLVLGLVELGLKNLFAGLEELKQTELNRYTVTRLQKAFKT